MIPGYMPAVNPVVATPGILWLWKDETFDAILNTVSIPGFPDMLAVQTTSRWVIAKADTGVGDLGQTIKPDPTFAVSMYVYVTAAGRMFATLDRNDLPAGAPSQLITYSPNGSPKWTAKKV